MRSTAFLFSASLALAGCSSHGPASIITDIVGVEATECPPEVGPYVFAPPLGFTTTEDVLIRGAAEKWNRVTKPDHRITFAANGRKHIVSWPPHEAGFVGQWSADLGTAFIRPEHVYVHETALHELGHALGLEHIPVTGTVMCSPMAAPGVDCGPADTAADEISPLDIAECRRVGACP